MAEKTITVKQTRSAIGNDKSQKATLLCLGLGRIGREVTHKNEPSIRGMLKKVAHLIEIRVA